MYQWQTEGSAVQGGGGGGGWRVHQQPTPRPTGTVRSMQILFTLREGARQRDAAVGGATHTRMLDRIIGLFFLLIIRKKSILMEMNVRAYFSVPRVGTSARLVIQGGPGSSLAFY